MRPRRIWADNILVYSIKRDTMKKYPVAIVLSALLLISGCMDGYTSLKPDATVTYYNGMLDDVITPLESPRWVWFRGRTSMDLDVDRTTREEAVVATIQAGDRNAPGPIEEAWLLICSINDTGNRTLLARRQIYSAADTTPVPQPANEVCVPHAVPFTHIRVNAVNAKTMSPDTIVVSLWGDGTPTRGLYKAWQVHGHDLSLALELEAWQEFPGILVANLDKAASHSGLGYQLLIESSSVPPRILDALGMDRTTPLWGHVFSADEHGRYHQADKHFGKHYAELETRWNKLFVAASMANLPPADMAWIELYLGMLNHYLANNAEAASLLRSAESHTDNTGVAHAAAAMLAALDNNNDPTDWKPAD